MDYSTSPDKAELCHLEIKIWSDRNVSVIQMQAWVQRAASFYMKNNNGVKETVIDGMR